MATIQKKEKGLNKYSFRGLTPDQLNELTQEQVVELYRARMRRRFTRSTSRITQKSSTNTSVSMLNARNPKRTAFPDRDPSPSRLISEMPSSCPRWSATRWLSTVAKPSLMSKSSSIWSDVTSENSQSLTSQLVTVRLVSEPPRDPPTHPLNDCTYFDGSFIYFSPSHPLQYLIKNISYELIYYLITMRKLLRTTPFMQVTRSSAPEYRPEANEQNFKNWWGRLNNLSSLPTSKVYLAQLSNLFAYFNKQVEDTTKVQSFPLSPSISVTGEARSSPKVSSIRLKSATMTCLHRNMTSRRSSTVSSPESPRPLTIL